MGLILAYFKLKSVKIAHQTAVVVRSVVIGDAKARASSCVGVQLEVRWTVDLLHNILLIVDSRVTRWTDLALTPTHSVCSGTTNFAWASPKQRISVILRFHLQSSGTNPVAEKKISIFGVNYAHPKVPPRPHLCSYP